MAGVRQLVSGPGGSGRTHRLRAWADATERRISGQVLWLRGSIDHRQLASPPRRLTETIQAATVDDAIAVDDAHWLQADLVDLLLRCADRLPVAVARASYPDTAALRELDDALTSRDPAERLTAYSTEQIADWIERDAHDADVDDVMHATNGWPGLVAVLLESDWPNTPVPTSVIDAVVRRARGSGSDVVQAGQMMMLGADLATAVRCAGDRSQKPDAADLERRLRVSGLVDGDRLIPIVAASFRADLTEDEHLRLVERLTAEGHHLPPDANARLLLVQVAREDPDTHVDVDHVAAAIRLGDPAGTSLLARLPDLAAPAAADAAFALDMRAMRWQRAGDRPIVGPTASRRLAIAAALAGDLSVRNHVALDTSEAHALDDAIALLRAHAIDAGSDVVAMGTLLVDDAIAARVEPALGWSLAAIAAPVVAASGDPATAAALAQRAAESELGGPGETRTHLLLAAFYELMCDSYTAALELVRVGPDPSWPHRDQLLLAALDAALARRSGDTTRLRDAWRRCDPLLTRQSVTWLLLDQLTEIVAAGRRVGEAGRAGTVVDALCAQTASWEQDGRGRLDRCWLRLQVAVAGEDWATVRTLGTELGEIAGNSPRSAARHLAGPVWAAVAFRHLGEQASFDEGLDTAVDRLAAVGDAWEASRLLGQTALDHPDPAAARALLERARSLVAAPVESADGLVAAGLTERESDVARLVVEGRTYKEIGRQLFISAKTVEHHVARIRQRLGAGSRAELLATIRHLSGVDGGESRGSSVDL